MPGPRWTLALIIACCLVPVPVATFSAAFCAPSGANGPFATVGGAQARSAPLLPSRSALARPHGVPASGRARNSFAGTVRCQSSSGTMSIEEAEKILSAYDAAHQEVARAGTKGLGGGTSATEWADAFEDRDGLRGAVEAMCGEATRVMVGICAPGAGEGVGALKAWVEGLGLEKGKLHGMDKDGEPLDMSSFGAVYIKYNSAGGEVSNPGDAMLNGYAGDFRGVYFAPTLPDGEFRQYAVLPLALFPAPGGGGGQQGGGSGLLAPVAPMLDKLGARAEVASFDASTGRAVIRFEGDESLKFGIEDALRGDPRVQSLLFEDF